MRRVLALILLAATPAVSAQILCSSNADNDERLRELHANLSRGVRETAGMPVARDGAFYLPVNEALVIGRRPFDLVGKSLIFEPRANGKYAVHREPLHWIEPASPPVVDFATAYGKNSVATFINGNITLFGKTIENTYLYLSRLNGIHLSAPLIPYVDGDFDALDAQLYRDPVISPLMFLQLGYAKVYSEFSNGVLIVTWRDSAYDVQAEIRPGGTIVFSYRRMESISPGIPIISAGPLDPAAMPRRALGGVDDPVRDFEWPAFDALSGPLDIRRVELARLEETDLLSLRITLGAPALSAPLQAGKSLRYRVRVGSSQAVVWIQNGHLFWTRLTGTGTMIDGCEVRSDGNAIELLGLQKPADLAGPVDVRVSSVAPDEREIDVAETSVFIDVAAKRLAADLSSVADGSELSLPIEESFAHGTLDPYAVWERVRSAYGLDGDQIDAVAMFETFHTDTPGVTYATGGSPGVDGLDVPAQGPAAARAPTLLQMNQLTYRRPAEKEAAQQMLHELGHRWLHYYYPMGSSDAEKGSRHPYSHIHAPAAFDVYGTTNSSVMGGANFIQGGPAMFRARVLPYGYSWAELYLMGLAAASEVPSWFYLTSTDTVYDYSLTTSARVTPVSIDRFIDEVGARNPSVAVSPKSFRVLFVLLTEAAAPTEAEIAKINEYRALMEKNFAIATGGRGRIDTEFTNVLKRRSARH